MRNFINFTCIDTLMMNTIRRATFATSTFVVNVLHEDNMWIADCDALHLTTEAETYIALQERVRQIAPELLELNGLGNSKANIRLSFQHIETAEQHRLAN